MAYSIRFCAAPMVPNAVLIEPIAVSSLVRAAWYSAAVPLPVSVIPLESMPSVEVVRSTVLSVIRSSLV